jgi:hypothetical protein
MKQGLGLLYGLIISVLIQSCVNTAAPPKEAYFIIKSAERLPFTPADCPPPPPAPQYSRYNFILNDTGGVYFYRYHYCPYNDIAYEERIIPSIDLQKDSLTFVANNRLLAFLKTDIGVDKNVENPLYVVIASSVDTIRHKSFPILENYFDSVHIAVRRCTDEEMRGLSSLGD